MSKEIIPVLVSLIFEVFSWIISIFLLEPLSLAMNFKTRLTTTLQVSPHGTKAQISTRMHLVSGKGMKNVLCLSS